MEGVTLLPAFKGLEQRDEQRPLFWEYVGNHAIRKGNWKLVAERSKDWELYDLASDRSETIDLAREFPKRVAELAREYNAWAKRVGSKSHAKCLAMKPSTQSQLFELP